MTERAPIRVLTVDDHEIFRGGIRFLLLAIEDIELVGEARSGDEALQLCENVRPDVVLMDIMMPEMDGTDATKAIRQRYPEVQVLALTSYLDRGLVQRAMQAGAIGYLLKGVSVERLGDAIRAAHARQPTLAAEALQALVQGADTSRKVGDDLSPREREVLQHVAEGLSNAEIAERLVLSVAAVKYHVSNILSKLGAGNRTEAVSLAMQYGLVPRP